MNATEATDTQARQTELAAIAAEEPQQNSSAPPSGKAKRQFGSAKGMIIFHNGWDDPCEDFAPCTK